MDTGDAHLDSRDRFVQVVSGADVDVVVSATPAWTVRTVGEGRAQVSVQTDALSLFRSLHGRRTRDHVREFAWRGDAEPYLDVWPGLAFSFPDQPFEHAVV